MKKKICPLLSDRKQGIECQRDACEFFDKESTECLFKLFLTDLDIIVGQNES